MKNIVYPYTCPFFTPSEYNQVECERHSDVYWVEGEFGLIPRVGCSLGREICSIAIDLDNPKSPRTADEFLDGLQIGNSEEERKSIEIHIREFFDKKMIEQKGGNGG